MPAGRRGALGGNKKISTTFALVVVIVVAVFFSGLVWRLNRQIKDDSLANFSGETLKNNAPKKDNVSVTSQSVNEAITYINDIGFKLAFPRDGRRYAVKEIAQKGMDGTVLFGLPFVDDEVKKVKKEDYSELFRIELVPLTDLGKKSCADKSRQFPFCDYDDRELGRNSQFVFVYTRYDKLDAVEKSKKRLIPADFNSAVFAQADEIAKSFRLTDSQVEGAEKKL